MRFKPGMLGACIVVLALLGTVLIGYNLGVDERTDYQTSYHNITNITSQFDYAPGDTFVQYNPAKNYSGYTPGTLTFTQSGTANQYGYVVTPGVHNTRTVDLTDTGFYSTAGRAIDSRAFVGAQYNNFWLLGGYRISVADLLSHEGINYALYPEGVDISLIYGDPYYFGGTGDPTVMMATPNLVMASNISTFNSSSSSGSGFVYKSTDPNTAVSFLDGTPWYWLYSSAGTSAYTSGGDLSYTIHVSKTGETRVISNGSVVDISNVSTTQVYWSDIACYTRNGGGVTPEGAKAPFGGATGNYGDKQVIELYNQGLTPTASVTISYDVGADVKYIRISDGVGFLTPTEYSGSNDAYTSTWDNGRENGAVSWVVKLGGSGEPVFSVSPTIKGYGNDIDVQVSRNASGNMTVSYQDTTLDNAISVALGAWDTALITFDAINRTLTASPVVNFSNFQNFTTSPSVFTVTDSFPVYSSISGTLTFENMVYTVQNDLATDYRFSVYETIINMGFNNNIFINPTLNPRSLFLPADYPILRITLDSVALTGQAITLNGVSYPVTNGSIIIDNNKLGISGLNITYSDDGHIYANEVDLGPGTDNNISLAGQWYFQARASYGTLDEVEVIDWEVGHWSIDMQQAIVIFELVNIAGIIVCYYKKSLSTLDWIIIIIAMFGGAVLFV